MTQKNRVFKRIIEPVYFSVSKSDGFKGIL